jgi:hypothetical protein
MPLTDDERAKIEALQKELDEYARLQRKKGIVVEESAKADIPHVARQNGMTLDEFIDLLREGCIKDIDDQPSIN